MIKRSKYDNGRVAEPVENRFWQKVKRGDAPNACWEWQAGFFKHPRTREETYGCVWVGSKRDGSGRMVSAHIVSWRMANGDFPAGMKVCHRCDNPKCVRPDHLFIGTQGDNMRDMQAKGRENKSCGSRSPHAKLTEDAVRQIRIECAAAGRASTKKIAEKYGVKPGTITDVLSRSWRHVA